MRSRPLALQSLVAQLAALPGVERVVIDDRATVVVLICQPAAARDGLIDAALTAMADLGMTGLEVEVAVRHADRREGRRIRFVKVSRHELPDRTISLVVHLEWSGIEVTGSAPSQPGEAPELRAVAAAALGCITSIVGNDLQLRVAGIKRVRSFDADLMVASLYRAGPPRQQLVGAVVVGDDALRAAAVAVLNALNRLLGNYLDR
jgi:hypothetical protein